MMTKVMTSKPSRILVLLLLISCSLSPNIVQASLSYDDCDSYSLPASSRASNLIPNTFHKICPGIPTSSSTTPLSHPQCGDGTPFAFYVTRPTQRKMNTDKLLIEFMGGGACWDSTTCGLQNDRLTFPTQLDSFVGLSCSEIEAGVSMMQGGAGDGGEGDGENGDGGNANGKYPVSMLCSKSVGGVDFTQYNTLVVPYCTQDVFVGSNTTSYDDGTTVHHVGADNTMAVLRWIYKNFPNPSHIVLTGCSAGGTALPIAYDLLNKHYNRWTRSPPGIRSVQISVVADSPVYLTPSYFLENALDEWDPTSIMKKLRFPYNKYRYDEDYSTKVWEHVLRRGPNADQWGMVTHNDDPISQIYFKYMGGMYDDNDDNDDGDARRRRLDEDLAELWWSSLSSSISFVQQTHSNVDTFVMDGEGHCSFGLYYALQENGFEEWAENILKEKPVLGRAHASVPLFFTSIALGAVLIAGTLLGRSRRREIELDDVVLLNDQMATQKEWIRSLLVSAGSFLRQFEEYPVTAGYGLAVTFYFITMLISGGFAHPLDNPSLGPSAVTLSSFGINNPTLIVYKSQLFRLITSGFLCSGFITYLMVVFFLYRHTRYIEKCIGDTRQFVIFSTAIALGCNLLYACIAEGASCSCVALILGLNAFSIFVGKRGTTTSIDNEVEVPFPRPIVSTITKFILSSLCFPFNSWIMLLSAIIVGAIMGSFALKRNDNTESSEDVKMTPRFVLNIMVVQGILAACLIMLFVLAFRIRKPNKLYVSPFLTGCDLVYAEVPADISSSFYSNDSRNFRWLDGANSGDNICAQFCVPHLVSRPLVRGASTYSGYSVEQGQCEDNDYPVHVADKTFSKATYSVDVEVYSPSSYGE